LDEIHAKLDEKQEYVVAFAYVFEDSRASSPRWFYDKNKAEGMICKGRMGILLRWTSSREDATAERVGLAAVQDIYLFVNEKTPQIRQELVLPVMLKTINII
jgi:hypothetical protein